MFACRRALRIPNRKATFTSSTAQRAPFGDATFAPRNSAWQADLRASFSKQTFMKHLGAQLIHAEPGKVDIMLQAAPTLMQQHGYFHAGVTTSIADSAAGYAAYTLMEPGAGVLTTELKVNLLAPAQGEQLVASGCVVIWDAASSAEVAAMKHGGGWVSGVALSRPPCSNIA